MANCSKCGAQLSQGAKACDYCGTMVEVPRSSATGGDPTWSTPGTYPAFKMSSVLVMVILTLLTFGLYVSIWFYTRRDELGRLDEVEAKKTKTLIRGMVGSQVGFFAMSYLARPGSEEMSIVSMLSIIFTVRLVYTAFHIRGLLRKQAGRVAPQSVAFVAPSGLLTFFLTIYYLQIHINRMISARMLDLKA